MRTTKKSKSSGPNLRRWLAAEDALLVGRVRVSAAPGQRPILLIAVWCPYCKRTHEHGWPEPPFRADHVEHRVAHCGDKSPLNRRGYYIGLDPAARKDTASVAEDYSSAVTAWKQVLARCIQARRPFMATAQDLAVLEPGIVELLREAELVKDDGTAESFCPNVIFGTRFKPRILALVGWERPEKDPVLSSSAAYDVVYDAIYNPMPPCRNCFCLPVRTAP